MIPETYEPLVLKLHDRTKRGDVNWRESKPNFYALDFESFTLAVRSYTDRDGDDVVEFTLRNDQGAVIDSFEVGSWEASAYKPAYELFQMARRKALNVDEAVAALTRAVDSPAPVGAVNSVASEDDIGEEIPF